MPFFLRPSDTASGSTVLEVLLEAHAECDDDARYGIEFVVEKLYGAKMFHALESGDEISDAHYAAG